MYTIMTALSLSLCHVVLTCFCPSVVVAVVVKKKTEILFHSLLFIYSFHIYTVLLLYLIFYLIC